MSSLKEHWFAYLLGALVLIVVLSNLPDTDRHDTENTVDNASIVPSLTELTNSEHDLLIRYGKELIDSTSKYFGPQGSIAAITNGLNCANCHRESGTKLYTNNFLAVAATYPKYRERSGVVESVEFRVNDCMQRSLNGSAIDTLSKEMKAMVAYIKWTGKYVKGKTEGAGTTDLPFLPRSADPQKGRTIYFAKCSQCHGENGEGLAIINGSGYIYPPLWGDRSYAVSAGMFRLSRLASFVKFNMPLGASYNDPLLTDEEAWDVAAFINSQPHPQKMFAHDWPRPGSKPADYPFGPFADKFSEQQHKYGPFEPIQKTRMLRVKKN